MGCGNAWERASQHAPTAGLGRGDLVLGGARWILASGTVFLQVLALALRLVHSVQPEAALGEWLWPTGCCLPTGPGRDPRELFRNLFSGVYFNTGWKLWKVGPALAAVVSQNHSW